MEAQEALNLLCDHLLGASWYIADPVGGKQANAIIVKEIKKHYKSYDDRIEEEKKIARIRNMICFGGACACLGAIIAGVIIWSLI